MAKTPVSMTIDGYKDREVLMVTYEFNQATDVEGQIQLRGEVGGQDGSLRGDHYHLQGHRVRQREVRERLGITQR